MHGKIVQHRKEYARDTDRHGKVKGHCLLNDEHANDQVRALQVQKPNRKAVANIKLSFRGAT